MMKRMLVLAVLSLATGCGGKDKEKPMADAEAAKKEQEQTNRMMKDTGEQRPGNPPK